MKLEEKVKSHNAPPMNTPPPRYTSTVQRCPEKMGKCITKSKRGKSWHFTSVPLGVSTYSQCVLIFTLTLAKLNSLYVVPGESSRDQVQVPGKFISEPLYWTLYLSIISTCSTSKFHLKMSQCSGWGVVMRMADLYTKDCIYIPGVTDRVRPKFFLSSLKTTWPKVHNDASTESSDILCRSPPYN